MSGVDRLVEAHLRAVAALAAGRPGEALTAAAEAAQHVHLLGDEPVDVVNVGLARARALRLADRHGEALRLVRRLLAVRLPDEGPGPRLRVQALLELGDALVVLGRLGEAEAPLRRALDLATRHLPPDDPDLGSAWASLGIWHRYRGEVASAEAAYARATALASDPVERAAVLHNVASLRHAAGDAAGAEAPARAAAALRTGALGEDHPSVAADLGVLAAVLLDLGRHDEAQRCFDAARAGFTAAFGPGCAELAQLAANEAALLHARGDLLGAERAYRLAEVGCRRHLGARHPQAAAIAWGRAVVAEDLGRPVEAVRHARRCADLLDGVVAEGHDLLASARRLAGVPA